MGHGIDDRPLFFFFFSGAGDFFPPFFHLVGACLGTDGAQPRQLVGGEKRSTCVLFFSSKAISFSFLPLALRQTPTGTRRFPFFRASSAPVTILFFFSKTNFCLPSCLPWIEPRKRSSSFPPLPLRSRGGRFGGFECDRLGFPLASCWTGSFHQVAAGRTCFFFSPSRKRGLPFFSFFRPTGCCLPLYPRFRGKVGHVFFPCWAGNAGPFPPSANRGKGRSFNGRPSPPPFQDVQILFPLFSPGAR